MWAHARSFVRQVGQINDVELDIVVEDVEGNSVDVEELLVADVELLEDVDVEHVDADKVLVDNGRVW